MTDGFAKARDAFMREQYDLARENLQVVLGNGFDPPTWQNLPIKVMLVITEIDEAVQAAKGGSTDPLPEELADIWIRISGILAALWEDEWAVRYGKVEAESVYQPIELHLWPIVSWCSKAVEAWRHDHRDDTRTYLELALKATAQTCRTLGGHLGVDLTDEVRKKLAKNASRERFHGKAKSSG